MTVTVNDIELVIIFTSLVQ